MKFLTQGIFRLTTLWQSQGRREGSRFFPFLSLSSWFCPKRNKNEQQNIAPAKMVMYFGKKEAYQVATRFVLWILSQKGRTLASDKTFPSAWYFIPGPPKLMTQVITFPEYKSRRLIQESFCEVCNVDCAAFSLCPWQMSGNLFCSTKLDEITNGPFLPILNAPTARAVSEENRQVISRFCKPLGLSMTSR